MPKKNKSAIFKKLLDPNQYTGSHQHRFDKDGHGLGFQGRDRIAKGVGTHMIKPMNGRVLDIAQIMRVDLGPHDFTKPTISTQKMPSIYKRLLDHRNFTGTHQHRFDEKGHGLGLQGRDQIPKGAGSVDVPYKGGTVRDIGDIMRLEMRTGTLIRSSSIEFLGKCRKHRPCKYPSCSANRHPISKLGLCTYHMWQDNEKSNYRKPGQTMIERHVDEATKCQVKKCGRKRAKDGELCKYHAWVKEKEEKKDDAPALSKITIGKELKKSTTVPNEIPLRCSIHGCQSSRFKLGYCVDHYEYLAKDTKESAGSKLIDQPTKSKKSRRKRKKFTVFDKLNDPSQYTGLHSYRFDSNGRGKGKDGRDNAMKGGTGFPKHRDGETVFDLSQLCRPNLH